MDWTQISATLISAVATVVVTMVRTNNLRKQANKHACRQSIMQLILEDKMSVMEGKLPENHQAILSEHDE